MLSRDGIEPTVLLVGAGERFTPAFQAALGRYRVHVETTELASVFDAVIVTAPDLVLLMGDAAKDGGADVLQKLSGLSQNFTVPVVVLHDDSELDQKLSAFRHGATAVLPRSASVDATAAEVAKMAREIPEQGTDSQGAIGEATLDEFVGALSRQLRSGLVSSLSGDAAPDSQDLKLVLGRGRPLTEFLDAFVRRVRRHVVRAEPLRYELGGAALADGPRVTASAGKPGIQGLRVVLADDDTPRADAVAQELRSRGVTVVVTDLEPSATRFQTLRQADPTVFVIGEEHAHGGGYELLRRVRRDSRLRWASLLVVRWNEIWSEERGVPTIQRLEATLARLAEPERNLLGRAEARAPFDARLEATGPARCLRTLEKVTLPQRLHVKHPRVVLTIDVSEGLVVGAEGRTADAEARTFSGVHALAALMVLGSGRLRVEPVDQPATANVMTPVEAALNMADAETPPITPSIPAASALSMPPAQPDVSALRTPGVPAVAVGAPVAATSVATKPAGRISRPNIAAIAAVTPAKVAVAPRASLQPAPIVPIGTPSVASVPRAPSAVDGVPVAAAVAPPPPARAPSRLAAPPTGTPNPPSLNVTPPMPFGALPMPAFAATLPASAVAASAVVPLAPARGEASAPSAPVASVAATENPVPFAPLAVASVAASELHVPTHERTPPAMTVPAAVAPEPSGGAASSTATAPPLEARWKAFLAWFSAQEAKLHHKRISGRVAAVLVGLGALQGLLIVLLYAGVRWLVRPHAEPQVSAAVRELPRSEAPPLPTAPPVAPQAAPASPAPAAAAPHVEPLAPDGSGREVPDCKTVLAADPPHEGFYPVAAAKALRAGRQAIVRGDLEAAQASLCRAVHYSDKNPEIAHDLAVVFLLRRDGSQALTWARRAVELDPNDPGAKDALGDALARTGNEAEARAAWLAAAGIDASSDTMVRALVTRAVKQADRSLRHRDLVTAERSFRRAAILEPRSQSSQSGLAYVLLELGDARAAVVWAQRAVDGAPRSSNARLVLGDALAKSDDKAGAAREWREAALLDPSNREAQKRLRSAGISAP